MELQGDLGDRAGAVSTYHHCASVLERELGVEPDPATRRSLDRLLARVGPAATPVQTAEPAAGRSGLAAAPLVGRSVELGVLQVLWRNAAAGRPSLALVRGDAGVEKTRQVAEIAAATIPRRGDWTAATSWWRGTARSWLHPGRGEHGVVDGLWTPRVAGELVARLCGPYRSAHREHRRMRDSGTRSGGAQRVRRLPTRIARPGSCGLMSSPVTSRSPTTTKSPGVVASAGGRSINAAGPSGSTSHSSPTPTRA